MRMKKNYVMHGKKAQLYPLFLIIFTIITLITAFIALNHAKKVVDLRGNEQFIGSSQAAVFASLQDADGLDLYLEQLARLSAQSAVGKIRNSCFYGVSTETVVDSWESPCGKYVYPQWSNATTLCSPDCQTAFLNSFRDDLLTREKAYYQVSGVELPISYSMNMKLSDDYFTIKGVSDSDNSFNVLSMTAREKAQQEGSPLLSTTPYSGGKLIWPIAAAQKTVISCFGLRDLQGQAGSADHPAIDIAAAKGTPVRAAGPGKVTVVDDCWGRLVINLGSGLSTEYLHLDTISVKMNDDVAQGQIIGTSGDRGCGTVYPEHLHFGVMYQGANPSLKYGNQDMVLHSFGTTTYIQPECLLEKPDSSTGSGCGTPINTELDKVCAKYNLPSFSASASNAADKATQSSLEATYAKWKDFISKASKAYGVPECQILAHIYQESRGNPSAVSYVGAAGLMQLMPDTARSLGLRVPTYPKRVITYNSKGDTISVPYCNSINSPEDCDYTNDERFDPEKNIMAGTRYLTQVKSYVSSTCKQDVAIDSEYVIAGYNCGPGCAAKKCLGTTTAYYAETQDYLLKVQQYEQSCQSTSLASAAGKPNNAPAATGNAVAGTSSQSQDDNLLVSGTYGSYAFKPSFSVRVNKKLDDPLKPVTEWFNKTWNECNDDPKSCIKKHMDDFNAQAASSGTSSGASSGASGTSGASGVSVTSAYSLSFADQCEEYPLFYDMMELFEDCFSSGKFSCSCQFDFSKAYSSKDLAILFDADAQTATLFVKESGNYVQKDKYSFFYGKIKPFVTSYTQFIYRFTFSSTGKISSATLTPLSDSESFTTENSFKDYTTLNLVKTGPNEGIISQTAGPACEYKKDKFRLCARPNNNDQSLLNVKFALMLKDRPPEPPKQAEITITEIQQGTETEMDGLVKALGLIPGLGEITALLDIASLSEYLDDFKPRALEVTAPIGDDIIGYEIQCNQFGITDPGFTKPEYFVLAKNAYNSDSGSQLSKYLTTNPYLDVLNGKNCFVPASDSTGNTSMVKAIQSIEKDGKIMFNIRECGGMSTVIDKLLRKDYCITLVPVDKNGNKDPSKAITNCAKTNSLMDIAIDDLLKRELGKYLPESIIPDTLQPYIKIPSADSLFSFVSGGSSLDPISLINSGNIDSFITQYLSSFVTKDISNQLIGNSFINSVNNLDAAGKQRVMGAVSSQITDSDAKMILNDMVSGSSWSTDARQAAITRGLDYIDNSKQREIVRNIAQNPGGQSYSELIRSANDFLPADEKRQSLLSAAQSGAGYSLNDKIVSAAINKQCPGGASIRPEAALNCLSDSEVNAVFKEALDNFETRQLLLDKSLNNLENNAPAVLKRAVASGDPTDFASYELQQELLKMPDSEAKSLLSSAMQGSSADSIIQSQVLKMIPAMPNDFMSSLMQNSDLNSVLGSTLKAELDKQLGLFFSQDCKPKI
jgi:hypothetical protein